MSNATLEPVAAFNKVQKRAEKICNSDAHTVATCSPGDTWAQGDIGIVCLKEPPVDAVAEMKPRAQLAPGTTQGSRHCIQKLSSVRVYRLASPTPLDGPIIEALEGFTVTHPEHGWITLPPGVYAIIYQRQFADEIKRVLD